MGISSFNFHHVWTVRGVAGECNNAYDRRCGSRSAFMLMRYSTNSQFVRMFKRAHWVWSSDKCCLHSEPALKWTDASAHTDNRLNYLCGARQFGLDAMLTLFSCVHGSENKALHWWNTLYIKHSFQRHVESHTKLRSFEWKKEEKKNSIFYGNEVSCVNLKRKQCFIIVVTSAMEYPTLFKSIWTLFSSRRPYCRSSNVVRAQIEAIQRSIIKSPI